MDEIRQDSEAKVEEGFKPKPDKYLGTKVTLEGEVPVWLTHEGKQYEAKPEDKPFAGIPRKFRPKHEEAMQIIYETILFVKQKMPRRVLPLLRNELVDEAKIPKQTLSDLIAMGLLKEYLLDVENKGRRLGKRAMVCFSPQGKAYVREVIVKRKLETLNG